MSPFDFGTTIRDNLNMLTLIIIVEPICGSGFFSPFLRRLVVLQYVNFSKSADLFWDNPKYKSGYFNMGSNY